MALGASRTLKILCMGYIISGSEFVNRKAKRLTNALQNNIINVKERGDVYGTDYGKYSYGR